jgi:hypothetical protein
MRIILAAILAVHCWGLTLGPCGTGKYRENKLSLTCKSCPSGTFVANSKANSGQADACKQCPANTFSSSAAASCTPCPGGSASVVGSASCTTCAVGSYRGVGLQCAPSPPRAATLLAWGPRRPPPALSDVTTLPLVGGTRRPASPALVAPSLS